MKKAILLATVFASTLASASQLSFPDKVTASCGIVFVDLGSKEQVYVDTEEIEGSQALENTTVELSKKSVSETEVVYEVQETAIFERGAPSYLVGLTFTVSTQVNAEGFLDSQLKYSIVGPTGKFKNTAQAAETIFGYYNNNDMWLSYNHEAIRANYGVFNTPKRTGLVNCSITAN